VNEIAGACAGSKRYLVRCLGGWGDVDALQEASKGELEVIKPRRRRLAIRWKGKKVEEQKVEGMEVDQEGLGTPS
jgi:hypothetical protein